MHLFVMDADGSNSTAVTDGAGELNIMPQWSGDGETLYFYQVRPTPDVSKSLCHGWCVAGNCAVVVRRGNTRRPSILAGARSSIHRSKTGAYGNRDDAISKPEPKARFHLPCTSSDSRATGG